MPTNIRVRKIRVRRGDRLQKICKVIGDDGKPVNFYKRAERHRPKGIVERLHRFFCR